METSMFIGDEVSGGGQLDSLVEIIDVTRVF